MIYTTNLIKRTIKEIKRKVKVIGALPSVSAVKKFVYLRIAMLNDGGLKGNHNTPKDFIISASFLSIFASSL